MARCCRSCNLNGYKIANPTILARFSHEELEALFIGYGYTPYFVEGDDPETMHQKMAATLDELSAKFAAFSKPRVIGGEFASALADDCSALSERLDRSEGIKGHKAEGSWRSHQVPFSDVRENADQLEIAGELAEELPARRALRLRRPVAPGFRSHRQVRAA